MNNTKQRHGCLTTWLIFIIIGNSLAIILNIFLGMFSEEARNMLAPEEINIYPAAALPLIILEIFNILCALALWNWKKWGFYGFIASYVAAFIINISLLEADILLSFFGFFGIGILYVVLNIGGENKAWSQLE